MSKFSERKGLVPVSKELQVNGMSVELRNKLWNILDIILWQSKDYLYDEYGEPHINRFSHILWHQYFKLAVDTIPSDSSGILSLIRKHFFKCEWHKVYDFIEFVDNYYRDDSVVKDLRSGFNQVLSEELAGYRLIDGHIVEVTDEQEVAMLQEALEDTKYNLVTTHLKQALKHLSNRENPDYRNSFKESISAVETMARIMVGDEKATLGDALKILEKKGKLHPALKNGFSSIYGYTNDSDGIRHSLIEESSLTIDDAKFFLLSCTSFVNYLKTKI